MVVYGAMEGERIYIGGSLYVGQECQNVEGVLPNRIFTHEDAQMLRPRNIFRKKFPKQEGSEDEHFGSDTSSSSPSLTATGNASSAEERDSETEFELAKTFSSNRKEKIVHRILCEDNQDIQVVEVGDDDESDENSTPNISTIGTTTTTTTTSTTPTSVTTVSTATVSAAATPRKSRIDTLCEKLRENSSFGKSEDVKYTKQLEDSSISSKNGLTSGKESPQPSKMLLQEADNQNEATVTPHPLPTSLPPPTQLPAQPTTITTEKSDSTIEKVSLKLLRHHLRKESVSTTSTSFAESDMKRESYMKSPHVTAEKEISIERSMKKSLSIKARKSSELAAKLDIILPVTYTASLKKSKSRDGLSACPIVLTAVRHRLKECSVVLHDCKVSVGESCSALLFEQKKYKCCPDSQTSIPGNQNEKPPRTSMEKASKQSSSLSQSQQKSERKRTRTKTSPILPSFSLPAPQALPATSSLVPLPTSWTAANPLSSLQQPPLKTPRVTSPTSIPTSMFPAVTHQGVTHQPQTTHFQSTTPSSVPQLTDDSKKAYPLLTQALTSIGSITHSSAPRFRQELYLTNSGPTGPFGQRPLDPLPLSSVGVGHSQFMPPSQEMMYVNPEASAEHDLRSSIFSSQFASFMDHVNRPLHPQEYAETYTHPKPQFPKWLHLQNQLLSYD